MNRLALFKDLFSCRWDGGRNGGYIIHSTLETHTEDQNNFT